jgi:DNA polymerase III alpha subunit
MAEPDRTLDRVLTETKIEFSDDLELENTSQLILWLESDESLEDFDARHQLEWHMPLEYQNFDIASWLLEQCKTEEQLQRVGKELLLYVDRDLLALLNYLKYIVDTMRVNNIVWGVGRGSSVASYVLYLIGIHRIDSIYYDLPIEEFLK